MEVKKILPVLLAAIGIDNDTVYKYCVPSVDYEYGGKVIDTHRNRLPM